MRLVKEVTDEASSTIITGSPAPFEETKERNNNLDVVPVTMVDVDAFPEQVMVDDTHNHMMKTKVTDF